MQNGFPEILYQNSIEKILKTTCQFFSEKNGKIKGWGSGVLLEAQNKYFIVTASHVYEDHQQIFIVSGNSQVGIEGEAFIVQEKNLDITVVEIPSSSVNALKKSHSFLSIDKLDINRSELEGILYVIAGYPSSRTKQKFKSNIVSTNHFVMGGRLKYVPKLYDIGYNKDLNISFHFNPKERLVRVDDEFRAQGPLPYGMSGCGIWYFPLTQEPRFEKQINHCLPYSLVGIATTYEKKVNSIVATRVDCISEILRIGCGINIPKSNYF